MSNSEDKIIFLSKFSVLLVVHLVFARAQFPIACLNDNDLREQKCCPVVTVGNSVGAECGGPGRGACKRIESSHCHVETPDDPAHVLAYLKNPVSEPSRYPWPNRVFKQICECEGNWAGYDCTECKFGYVKTADKSVCVKRKTPLVRRNYMTLDDDERDYVKQTIADMNDRSKSPSRYGVLISEENFSKSSHLQSNLTAEDFKFGISAYEFLTWIHYYTAKDSGVPSGNYKGHDYGPRVDFAHNGPSLLTWHRYFMLLFESELQRVSGNDSFAAPYWDWMDRQNRDHLFTHSDIFDGNETSLVGVFRDFRVICCEAGFAIPLTEPNIMRRSPKRGPGSLCNASQFDVGIPLVRRDYGHQYNIVKWLPSARDAWDLLVNITHYDVVSFNLFEHSPSSLRAGLEGSVPLPGKHYCSVGGLSNESFAEEMHNAVHIYAGGVFTNVAMSPSDPIFYLHHSMVDRMFERFMIKLQTLGTLSYIPESGVDPGHNANDCIVPSFPLYRNREFLQRSTDFGYVYDTLPLLDTEPERPAEEYDQCNNRKFKNLVVIGSPIFRSCRKSRISLLCMLLIRYYATVDMP